MTRDAKKRKKRARKKAWLERIKARRKQARAGSVQVNPQAQQA
jgi:hypothetical protein